MKTELVVRVSLLNTERRFGAIYVGFPRVEAVAHLFQHILILITDISVAQIVNKDEDDVGLWRLLKEICVPSF
ncbi:MAG: hypothetical protein M3458_00840 [Acidobacteriota bacterium]|nr:hypothetical protein [Acidobacteriota bacterium]